MLQQLLPSHACLIKTNRCILLNVWKASRFIFKLREVQTIVILHQAQIVQDSSTLNKFAGLFNTLKSNPVLQRVKAMLENPKAPFNTIPGSGMSCIESFLWSVKLSTEWSNKPVIVWITSITKNNRSRKNSIASGLKLLPQSGLTKNLQEN